MLVMVVFGLWDDWLFLYFYGKKIGYIVCLLFLLWFFFKVVEICYDWKLYILEFNGNCYVFYVYYLGVFVFFRIYYM